MATLTNDDLKSLRADAKDPKRPKDFSFEAELRALFRAAGANGNPVKQPDGSYVAD